VRMNNPGKALHNQILWLAACQKDI